MSFILNIDTAVETARISVAKDGSILAETTNTQQKDHAAFLQPAIDQLLRETSVDIRALDAVAVAAGPGSYTGLRVGMASAKGLCYALGKPLITISSLEILTLAAITENQATVEAGAVYCPMIDARRMEVFTALYDAELHAVWEPRAMIIDESSFLNILLKTDVYFFGNGSSKWAGICRHPKAHFLGELNTSLAMSNLSHRQYHLGHFADLAYSEPLYLKEFYTTPPAIKPG